MSYTVDDMCKAGCTTRRGVRFWEEQGLLGDVERTGGNQRRFTASQISRAKIIAAAQFGGWKLDEIKAMLDNYDHEAQSAIVIRLSNQAKAAAMLAEALPPPVIASEAAFDL